MLHETERLPGLAPAGGGTGADTETWPEDGLVPSLTVFLTGAECPFSCVFCDLWQHTLAGPTPRGALPAQLRQALAPLSAEECAASVIKLYNASNFFEPRAVPPQDDPALIELLRPCRRTVVECHPRLLLSAAGRQRCLGYAQALRDGVSAQRGGEGGCLEVAVGLETVHPEAFPRLNKGMSLEDFDRAAEFLAGAGVGLRVFVLVGAPFVSAEEAVEWAVRSAEHAFACGAGFVSLIPVRGDGEEMQRLREVGEWVPPTLGQLEAALDACLPLARTALVPGAVVAADLWDLERFSGCATCLGKRKERLKRINLSGHRQESVHCARCDH